MKILFICGCLEPGRDGVGDYVQRLSEELIRLNHTPFALALNDPYVETHTMNRQVEGTKRLSALRLPSTWRLSKRLDQAKLWMDIVDPDLVSIQYVPFSFHGKGLPVSLGSDVKGLAGNRSVHIMIHETWVGAGHSASLKQKIYSAVQRWILKRTLKKTKPRAIHSHLPSYCKQIEALGFEVKPLPLFSNIPLVPGKARQDEKIFRIGFLSQAEPVQEVIDFLKHIIAEVSALGARPQVLLIGGSETKMQTYKEAYERIPGLKGNVSLTGFLKDQDVSAQIQTCQLGMSPVPRHALGKSGSVAAFLSHGIPVAAPVVHQDFGSGDIGFFSASVRKAILLEPSFRSFAEARKEAITVSDEIALSTIAQSFTKDLNIK